MDSNFLSLINMLYLKRPEGFKVFLELKDNQIISLYILDYFKYNNPREYYEFILTYYLLQLMFIISVEDIIKLFNTKPFLMQTTKEDFFNELNDIKNELIINNPKYTKNVPTTDKERSNVIYYMVRRYYEQLGHVIFPTLFTNLDLMNPEPSTGHIYFNFLDHLFFDPLSRLKQQFFILLDGKFIPFSRHDEERLNSYCFNEKDPCCNVIYTEKLNSILKLKNLQINTSLQMNYYPKEFLDYYKNICLRIEKIIQNPDILNLPHFLEATNQEKLNLLFFEDETQFNNFKNFWKQYCNKFLFPLYKDNIFKK